MAVPRIGRPDRLAALDVPKGPFGPPRSPSPPDRVLNQSIFLAPAVPGPSRQALATAAAELARQLAPLPSALDEIVAKVLRHCVHRDHPKHEEALAQLDALQARTMALWRAVATLRVALGPQRDGEQ